MKRLISLLLLFLLLLSLASCGEKGKESGGMPTVLNPAEYVLYTNIFYNQTGDDYLGQSVTKTGTFAVISDSYRGTTRYYVWGYNDQTKCCDWQWEFIPGDTSSLPKAGSLIEVKGTFSYAETALDGYYLADASVTVKTPYEPGDADLLLTTMSDTLERVQLWYMQAFPAQYEGKTVTAYGRIAAPGLIEDPYYNESWTQSFDSSDPLPAIGKMAELHGVYRSGTIAECRITESTQF